jgi:diguanylate cyclase (GGDEF)-like protein
MIRALVVEDSRSQGLALRKELEAAHFEVALVETGQAALALLESEQFDVIVSDIVMSGLDGYELCRRVKNDPASRETPVVLLTSLTDPLDVVAALESGADNFVRKPYHPEQLVARLRAAVDNRHLRGAGPSRMGVQLSFMGRVLDISADRQQLLDLLISTFEELVVSSRQTRDREEELSRAREALERELQRVDLAHNRLQAVVDAVPVPLFVIDPGGSVSHVSEASAGAFGVTAEQLCDRGLDETIQFLDHDGSPVPPEALPHRRAADLGLPVSAGTAFDLFIARPDTEPVPVVLHASPVLDTQGRPAGCVGTAHVLGPLSQHDPVTGLPNNATFLEHAAKTLAAPQGSSALMLLGLDRFHVTRVTRGADAGNEVLAEVSRVLRNVFTPRTATLGDECLLAYLGGSQFGIVVTGLDDSVDVLQLAEAARRAVAAIRTGGEELRLTASVGVALDDPAHPAAALLGAASAALHRAQEAGGDRVEVFSHEASHDAIARLQLERDLRTAIDRREIALHYQPEVDLLTGRLLGFEALARWQHPTLGFIEPTRFIEVAEESGLIMPLGRQVLQQACTRARSWQEAFGEAELSVAVNVSAKQLRPSFVDEVVHVLQETGLDPRRLVLELTETAAMSHPEASLPILHELAERGVRLALDDFGTGYSSMAHLTRIPFDQLKLDRGFVKEIQYAGPNAIVAQSIIALGHSLGIPILAEGIEELEQAQTLRTLGCDQGQGYLFGRPVSGEALEEWLPAAHARDFLVVP